MTIRTSLALLAGRAHDVVVVGGGIFGACAAWDAALRGLAVALIERGDFAGATSGHCFKMVHGGIRYLQHGDLARVRESSRERSLLRIAPYLVHPLPIVVPTFGAGAQGKVLLRLGLALYDAVTFDRDRGIGDPGRRIPRGQVLGRNECLARFPWLRETGITGGGLFYDGQMDPARLALAFVRSAVNAGAVVANYTEAVDFLRRGDRVQGVRVRDVLTGETFDVRGRMVLNAAGPWAEPLLRRHLGVRLAPACTFSRDAYFVVPGRLTGDHALALQGSTRDPDALVSRGSRHLFLVPWRDCTLIGVWHDVYRGNPNDVTVTEADLARFLSEVNTAPLPSPLSVDDVCGAHAGLVLFGDNAPGAVHLSYGKRSRLVDHGVAHGLQGLFSMIGVRYTTARGVAERAIDQIVARLGRRVAPPATAVTPLHGGDIDCVDAYLSEAVARRRPDVDPDAMRALVRAYGTAYPEVLTCIDEQPGLAARIPDSPLIQAQVVHAARDEMAATLGDVVFRRTDLGTDRHPGEAALRTCAELMAAELGWSRMRLEREMDEVRAACRGPHAAGRQRLEATGT
jgi:glycerol-3-phosphate dehydrogenase